MFSSRETNEQGRGMVRRDSGGVMPDRCNRLPILALQLCRFHVRPVYPSPPGSELREYVNVLDVRDYPSSDDTVEPVRNSRNGESRPGLSHWPRYRPVRRGDGTLG